MTNPIKRARPTQNNGHSLPNDVMFDIFSRLSIKTLKRLSCVCKSWYSIFQDSTFITSYNRKNTANRNLLLFTYAEVSFRLDSYHLLQIYLLCNETMQLSKWLFPINFPSEPNHCECEGLIWVFDHYKDVSLLLNPATREFKPLRHSHVKPPPDTINYYIVATGLGYDSITNDYKMVRVIRNQGDYGSCGNKKYTYQAEVYSLSNDSWKEISCYLNDEHVLSLAPKSTYLNGRCYWWVEETEKTEFGSYRTIDRYILTFDMFQETFQTMRFPTSCSVNLPNSSEDGYFPGLRVMNNRLAFFLENTEEFYFEIWVMKDCNNSESWFKERADCQAYDIMSQYEILGIWTNDEWFLRGLSGSGCELMLRDLNTDTVKDLASLGDASKDIKDILSCDEMVLLEVFIVNKNLFRLNAK